MQEMWVRFLIQKIPTCVEQLSLWVTTIEAELLSLGAAAAEHTCSPTGGRGPQSWVLQQEKPHDHQDEKPGPAAVAPARLT